jgi:dolichol kinase
VSLSAVAREVSRKALHLSFASVPLALAAGARRGPVIAVLGGMFGVAVGLELARVYSPAVGRLFARTVGPLLRAHEQSGHHVSWTGATWLIGVCLAAVWLLPRDQAIAVTWAVTVGDACAALFGVWLGGRTVARGASGKSFEGAAACAVVTAVGAYALAGMSLGLALAVGAAASVTEWQRSNIDDNLRIGAATAVVVMVAERAGWGVR